MDDPQFQPAACLILKDLEAIKTITDPMRNQIMDVLTHAPMTVTQVAKKLGLETSKLYYHINLLEKHGFIQVVDTTLHGNLIEKHYWITAHNYEVDKEILNFSVETPEGTENLITMLLANIDATREELVRSMNARHYQISHGAPPKVRQVIDFKQNFNLSEEKAKDFHTRIFQLIEEFKQEAEAEEGKETHPWSLTMVMFPSFYFDAVEENPSADAGSEGNENAKPK